MTDSSQVLPSQTPNPRGYEIFPGGHCPPGTPARADGGLLVRLEDRLDLHLDQELLADEDPTGLEDLVPRHAEILAIDLAGGGEGGDGLAPGVLGNAKELPVQHQGLGDP